MGVEKRGVADAVIWRRSGFSHAVPVAHEHPQLDHALAGSHFVASGVGLAMRMRIGIQIVYVILLSLGIVVCIAGMFMGAAGMAAGLGWPISLFGWTVPTELPGIWGTIFSWLGLALGVYIVFGEKIKSCWENPPKAGEVWSDIQRIMREHKWITALAALFLLVAALSWIVRLVVYLAVPAAR